MSDFGMSSNDFYQALAEDQLIGSHCPSCGMMQVPQRQICPNCHSDENKVVTFSGQGTLAGFSVITVPTAKMASAGYDWKNPYCVGIVELDEGPCVSAQIIEIDLSDPEKIKIGMPVTMQTLTRAEGENKVTYLAFKPKL